MLHLWLQSKEGTQGGRRKLTGGSLGGREEGAGTPLRLDTNKMETHLFHIGGCRVVNDELGQHPEVFRGQHVNGAPWSSAACAAVSFCPRGLDGEVCHPRCRHHGLAQAKMVDLCQGRDRPRPRPPTAWLLAGRFSCQALPVGWSPQVSEWSLSGRHAGLPQAGQVWCGSFLPTSCCALESRRSRPPRVECIEPEDIRVLPRCGNALCISIDEQSNCSRLILLCLFAQSTHLHNRSFQMGLSVIGIIVQVLLFI